MQFLDRKFQLSENNTTVRIEILAGMTTFLTMAYIIFVQPAILSKDFAGQPTGLDTDAILLATCLGSAFASVFMGLYAKYPIALAPGMGENFFFISTIMAMSAMGFTHPWQTALGIVFYAGVLFLILSILKVREALLNAISPSLRNGIAIGIGIFIAFIGLKNGGVIIGKPGTLLGLNTNFLDHSVLADITVFLVGLVISAGLYARNIRGSILWGILASAVVAILFGKLQIHSILGIPDFNKSAIFKMDLVGALSFKALPFIFVFLFMDLFDTIGTLIGVSEQAGFIKDNKLPRAEKVLVVDSASTIAGACLGTSTITSYIESAAGVAYGGRTGLTSVTVGILFILALLFSPLIACIGSYLPVTSSALVIVGALMMKNVTKIDWNDFSEVIPAFLIAIGIPLTFSISDGISIGFVAYPIVKLISGKGKTVTPLMYIVAAVIVAYYAGIRILI
ncbi:MAG: hypothetical protein A2283_12105 [Lentisphaerae bacterium RIFOXYA12_FULL_48_11]|nr:MAG: hypothetical protein A2283_12105 [Lentisphaerae bacterium RIFOXYA12_FULL_48_11]